MQAQTVFKRHELKYMLTRAQYESLKETMKGHMILDQFGRHTIHNVYFDTDDFLLIRRSIEKPTYKEKLRVRSYGTATKDSRVFVEVKKKYQGIVYKRRMELPAETAYDFLLEGSPLPSPTQISREISYFVGMYQGIKPQILLDYDREAFYGVDDSEFRITFDHNITTGRPNGKCTTPLLDDGMVVLEVKTAMGIPSWLLSFLSQYQIYKTSFSKCGTAYQRFLCPQLTGGTINVA